MENVINIFGNIPIYWINLNRSVDRRKNMEQQFKKYGLTNNIRIEAIDKNTLTGKYVSKYYKTPMSRGQYACSLSHRKAVTTAYENNDEYCIILEDDADFSLLQYNKTPIKDLIKNPNAKCIQLFSFSMHINLQKNNTKKKDLNKGHHWSALAYVLRRERMKEIIKRKIIDIADGKNYIYDKYNTYHVSIPYFIPSLFKSEINDKIIDKHKQCVNYWKNFYD